MLQKMIHTDDVKKYFRQVYKYDFKPTRQMELKNL